MEPERCPSFANALKAGTPVFTPTTASIADGLTVPTVGCNAVATAAPLIDKMVQVSYHMFVCLFEFLNGRLPKGRNWVSH